MKIKNSVLFVLMIIFMSCDGVSHDKTTIVLTGFLGQQEIIYETKYANIHFGYDDFIEYFKEKGLCERCSFNSFPLINDSTYNQFISYSKPIGENPIIISDTLATKLKSIENVLTRVKDNKHIHYELSDDIKWIILEFAVLGKLKVFDKQSNSFVDEIVIDDVVTKTEMEYCPEWNHISITLINESIILTNEWGCNSF